MERGRLADGACWLVLITALAVGLCSTVAGWLAARPADGTPPDPSRPASRVQLLPAWAHVSAEQLAEAKRLGVPVAVAHDAVGLRFVLVPGTETVRPFYLQVTELTVFQLRACQQQLPGEPVLYWTLAQADEKQHDAAWPVAWKVIQEPARWTAAGGRTQGSQLYPLGVVTPAMVRELLAWLNKENQGGRYRLPTLLEWGHAARAGTDEEYYRGLPTDDDRSREFENWGQPGRLPLPTTVGSLRANPWGLHDMLGNVSELVAIERRSDASQVQLRLCGGSHSIGLRAADWSMALPTGFSRYTALLGVGVRLVRELPDPR